jgi:hypothetical protein
MKAMEAGRKAAQKGKVGQPDLGIRCLPGRNSSQ